MERLLRLLPLSRGAAVFDAGCGKAELLLRLVETRGARAVGVDKAGPFLEEGREQARQRVPDASLELHEMDISAFEAATGSFDMAVCMGSTHLYGGLQGTLRALGSLVRPGGCLVVTEGYWKRDPAPEYLAALESTAAEFTTHAGNVAAAVAGGWVLLYSFVASDEDWDDYEGCYLYNVEQYAFEHPEDPDVPAMLGRIRRWRDAYLSWGRDTLGFGLYLLRRAG